MRLALLLLLAAAPAPAPRAVPPRAAAERQALADLAYELGRAHALRRACAGSEDGLWRDRMNRVLAIENADAATRPQLVGRFNIGFAEGRAAFPTCTAASRDAARESAARAARLSRELAGPPHA